MPMLKFKVGGVTCRVSLLFPAVLLWMLWWDPTGTVLLGATAALMHECGHLTAFLVIGSRPDSLTVSFYGIRITNASNRAVGYVHEAITALCGPLVNILCAIGLWLLGARELFALCHMGLAAVNLLPIEPLDGANVISALLHLLPISDSVAERVTAGLSYVCFCFLVLLGIAVYMHSANITLLVMSLYIGVFMLFYKGN